MWSRAHTGPLQTWRAPLGTSASLTGPRHLDNFMKGTPKVGGGAVSGGPNDPGQRPQVRDWGIIRHSLLGLELGVIILKVVV